MSLLFSSKKNSLNTLKSYLSYALPAEEAVTLVLID